MRILIIATSSNGGAGIAAKRSFLALKNSGADASFISLDESIGTNGVKISRMRSAAFTLIRKTFTAFQSIFVQNSSKLYTGLTLDFASHVFKNLIQDFDVIHVHSMYNFIGFESIDNYVRKGKSVFITMHDERLGTGGCHYTEKCRKIDDGCKNCPIVRSSMKLLPPRVFLNSKEFFQNNPKLILITPSKWLLEEARKNPILKRNRIEVINNPIPNEFFDSFSESLSKNYSVQTIGFISQNAANPYKGLSILVEALENLDQETRSKVKLLIATESMDLTVIKNFEYELFHPKKQNDLIDFYRRIDVLVVPSLEDNSPSVIGEALACGVPVIGSNVGGIPELLEHFDQKIFEVKNVAELSTLLLTHLNSPSIDVDIPSVKAKLGEEAHAKKLLDLYREFSSS